MKTKQTATAASHVTTRPAGRHSHSSGPVLKVDGGPALGILDLQRLAGNAAVQRAITSSTAGPVTVQRRIRVVKIQGEKVRVHSDAEQTEADGILTEIKTKYGVTADSATVIAGIKAEYPDVKKSVKNRLRARTWRMIDLRALKQALGYYGAILGAERAKSTRSGVAQEVAAVGKVKNAINEDTPAGKLDTTTLGEYFSSKKAMGLFKSSENYVSDFKTEREQLVGTFVHEIGHGLLSYAIPDYIAATAYWKDANTELPKAKRFEKPMTDYGKTNAAEDICESAMMFFVEPKRLAKKCPKRYAFMVSVGKAWIPAPKATALVEPTPTPEAGGTTTDVSANVDVLAVAVSGLEQLAVA